jgi:hypothetical protein
MMPQRTPRQLSEVEKIIAAYVAGEIDDDTLIDTLANHKYASRPAPQSDNWFERNQETDAADPYIFGGFQEVTFASQAGKIPKDVYYRLLKTMDRNDAKRGWTPPTPILAEPTDE